MRNRMAIHAAALMGERLDEIDSPAILACLSPIWTDKQATAVRVSGLKAP